MTWGDLIRKYKPEATDEEVEFILWERTAFPMAPTEYVIKQIEEFFKSNGEEVQNM